MIYLTSLERGRFSSFVFQPHPRIRLVTSRITQYSGFDWRKGGMWVGPGHKVQTALGWFTYRAPSRLVVFRPTLC